MSELREVVQNIREEERKELARLKLQEDIARDQLGLYSSMLLSARRNLTEALFRQGKLEEAASVGALLEDNFEFTNKATEIFHAIADGEKKEFCDCLTELALREKFIIDPQRFNGQHINLLRCIKCSQLYARKHLID